jgi:hypothetical protein
MVLDVEKNPAAVGHNRLIDVVAVHIDPLDTAPAAIFTQYLPVIVIIVKGRFACV